VLISVLLRGVVVEVKSVSLVYLTVQDFVVLRAHWNFGFVVVIQYRRIFVQGIPAIL